MESCFLCTLFYVMVKIYAPSLPKPYDLIICYHAELVYVNVHMMLKLDICCSLDDKTTVTLS